MGPSGPSLLLLLLAAAAVGGGSCTLRALAGSPASTRSKKSPNGMRCRACAPSAPEQHIEHHRAERPSSAPTTAVSWGSMLHTRGQASSHRGSVVSWRPSRPQEPPQPARAVAGCRPTCPSPRACHVIIIPPMSTSSQVHRSTSKLNLYAQARATAASSRLPKGGSLAPRLSFAPEYYRSIVAFHLPAERLSPLATTLASTEHHRLAHHLR